jgi:hypothetical protein
MLGVNGRRSGDLSARIMEFALFAQRIACF